MARGKSKQAAPRLQVVVANARATGQARAAQKSAAARRGKPGRPLAGLDRDGAAWAKLLADPCYGQLAHPVYQGGEGGYLARFENEQTLFTDAGMTAGVLAWVPGAFPNGLFAVALNTDSTTGTLAAFPGIQPGLAFLQSTASAVRCVSACMQVSWPGTELNRQGFVTLGQSTGSLVSEYATGFGAGVTSVNAVRPLCHLRTRVPETMAEVKWRPGYGDGSFTDPNGTIAATHLNECGALLLTAANLPSTTGIRVRFIVTYEWQPRFNQGITSGNDMRSASRNTTSDVLTKLDSFGKQWAYVVGHATSVLGSMNSAYTAGRAARMLEL